MPSGGAFDADDSGSGPSIESSPLFLLGVSLAVAGNTLIACSLTLQKYCVNREAATGVKASSTPLFWVALVGMIAGEVGNFTAFGFASQTVVSPLGAVSVIVNTILAAIFLKEGIYRRTLGGIALTLAGASLVVLFSPPPLDDLSTEEFLHLLSHPSAYGYLVAVGATIIALWVVEPWWGAHLVLIDVMLCSLLGSITVICSTALSKFIRLALNNDRTTIMSPVPYILIPILVTTAVLQLRFLNKAMANFNSAVVVPTYYVTFTLCSISGGIWVFDEAWRQSWFAPLPQKEWLFFLGVLLCVIGVAMVAIKPAVTKPTTEPTPAEQTAPAPARTLTLDGAQEEYPGVDARTELPAARSHAPSLSRAATFHGIGKALSLRLSAVAASFSAGSAASAEQDRSDLRGSVNVVTGVGTMQHLHRAFSSWNGPPSRPGSSAPSSRRRTHTNSADDMHMAEESPRARLAEPLRVSVD